MRVARAGTSACCARGLQRANIEEEDKNKLRAHTFQTLSPTDTPTPHHRTLVHALGSACVCVCVCTPTPVVFSHSHSSHAHQQCLPCTRVRAQGRRVAPYSASVLPAGTSTGGSGRAEPNAQRKVRNTSADLQVHVRTCTKPRAQRTSPRLPIWHRKARAPMRLNAVMSNESVKHKPCKPREAARSRQARAERTRVGAALHALCRAP